MVKKLLGSRFRFVFSFLGLAAFVALVLGYSGHGTEAGDPESGILEKMIVANGTVTMNVDMQRLGINRAKGDDNQLRFETVPNAFFTVLVFNNEFRGPIPGSMEIIPQHKAELPGRLDTSFDKLVVENTEPGSSYELVVSDGTDGFPFFNITGHEFKYEPESRGLAVREARLLLSKEFATALGRPGDAGTDLGTITFELEMRPIEVTRVVNGEITESTMPVIGSPETGTVPGPDVIVGDVYGLAQFGTADGDYVGLAVGTNSCNAGTIDLNWFALPNNDHPVIPQNMYRMSGGPNNDERFEQIGQSSVKHAFTALTQNICGFGCNGVGGSRLGSGCSDPYSASLNAGPNLGSRAWINPFTGFFPRGDSATPPNSHSGHSHTGTSHRILTPIASLANNQNPGATYYAEAQYVTPHEYAWCQANPGQCNMYNNVSYRRYSVNGNGPSFTFTAVGATQREKPAVHAWPDATIVQIEPDPGNDGIGMVAYKVTNPSAGVWRYEYAIFNQNIDRGIQRFTVPTGPGVVVSNIGFHAPTQHPGWTFDGTVGNAGYSSTPWGHGQTSNVLEWSTETFAQNPNANAIRWGTMYNFRFESNRPPETKMATIGFFKNGDPIQVQVQAPGAESSNATVSGRIMTAQSRGVANAMVTISDGAGFTRTIQTGSFGTFTFFGVPMGATYTISVNSGRYTFSSQQVDVTGDLSDINFFAASK
jgi:hypothetical protein